MRHGFGRVDKSFFMRQRLILENDRLYRMCAEAKETAARYALLLREGDHRIKNSLQVVVSLLGLQAHRETSVAAQDALNVASARIHAVAHIHDMLHLDAGSDVVDIGALVASMSQSLNAMAGDPGSIEIIVSVEPISIPIKTAQSIVLAVNELVTNALRHAFPDNRRGCVVVSVAQKGVRLEIIVADNGVGMPYGGSEGRGYGMTLIRAMVAEIGGNLAVERSAGTRFTLTAPLRQRSSVAAEAQTGAFISAD